MGRHLYLAVGLMVLGMGVRAAEKEEEKRHWAFEAVRAVTPPGVKDGKWGSNDVDRFVLIRRATFDLTGLPPTPEEVQAFLKDGSADAYDKVIDRLLASPRYGERWGRHWLDVVRFGESHGYEQNHLRDNAWPYRDYVIRSFNEDKPYPRFVMEQLAGDVVGKGEADIEVATGFLV